MECKDCKTELKHNGVKELHICTEILMVNEYVCNKCHNIYVYPLKSD